MVALGALYGNGVEGLGWNGLAARTAIAALYLAHGYSLNDLFDGRDGSAQARAAAPYVAAAGIVLACAFSALIHPRLALLVAAGSFAAFIYVAPPLRLKNRLLPNFALNSLAFFPLFLLGAASPDGGLTGPGLKAACFFAFLFIPFQALHHIAHSGEDLKTGAANIRNAWGRRPALWFFHASCAPVLILSLGVELPGTSRLAFLLSTSAFCLYLCFRVETLARGARGPAAEGREMRGSARTAAILYGIAAGLSFL